jgi:DNA replicative helicase MCM subunit Mcm2 (Cdc46/Mcm family)
MRKHRNIDTTPITSRQLESMIRLSEARARCELRDTIEIHDVLDVIEIMRYSLWEINDIVASDVSVKFIFYARNNLI